MKWAHCAGKPTGELNLEGIRGGVPGYTYEWVGADSIYYTENPKGVYAGVYTLTVSDANACLKTDSNIEVFEADLFDVDTLVINNYNGSLISCAGASDAAIYIETEGGRGPYTFEWNTGATTQLLEGLPAGTYSVVVYDSLRCADSTEFTIEEPLPLGFDIDPLNPLCYGDSTGSINMLVWGGTVNTLDDYQVWLNGALRYEPDPYIRDLPEGIYEIEIRDLNNCKKETSTELTQPYPLELNFSTVDAYCPDATDGELHLDINGGTYPYFIEWDRGLADMDQDFYDVQWGKYVATVTDNNFCVTRDSVQVGYTYETCLVIPNAFSPNGDGFNDLWVIENIELYPQVDLKIFDRWGNMVYITGNAADEPWDGRYGGRILPIDSYHYVIDLNFGDNKPITGNVTIVR